MSPEQINGYAKRVYAQNKLIGWWDDPERCPLQTIQLVVTEVAEATEGDRKNLNDDHLPHRKMAEVELADTFIRLVDLAGHYNWKYSICTPHPMLASCKNTAARHLSIVCAIAMIAEEFAATPALAWGEPQYNRTMATLLEVARIERADLQGAIEEKMAYNLKRQDHKRENRAKDDGKKY